MKVGTPYGESTHFERKRIQWDSRGRRGQTPRLSLDDRSIDSEDQSTNNRLDVSAQEASTELGYPQECGGNVRPGIDETLVPLIS